MSASSRASWRVYLFALVCVVLLLTAGIVYVTGWSAGNTVPHERYYRAVFVLQSLGGPAARERVDIPRRVPYADATESLLHHPDKIFVLGHVAEELAQVRRDVPKAVLFEAYARLGLGERSEAARLLEEYVVESDYNADHYALLCEMLYDLGDYSSLLMLSREWRERDPSCRGDRTHFAWAALHNLERYAQAAEYMRTKGECLGWQAGVYAAKSVLALSGEREAGLAIDALVKRHADDAPQILRFWKQIKDKERV